MNAWEPALTPLVAPLSVQVFGLQVALAGTIVGAIVLGVAWGVRRRSEPARYALLLAGVIGMLSVPGLIGLQWSIERAYPPAAVEVEAEIIKVPVEKFSE